MKKIVKLNESQLKRIISESVKKVLREVDEMDANHELLRLVELTADYMSKFDASDEVSEISHALHNWSFYNAGYISSCLDYAIKHAHKCFNIDIDEDPVEYLSIAYDARDMWNKYMM